MPTLRLPLLVTDAGALKEQAPAILYALAALLATLGTVFIYWPAALLVLSGFLLALVVL